MPVKIFETSNTKLFELWGANRDVEKIKKLMESMKKHGWINSRPMSVVQGCNGKIIIKDGHHRFEAAQRLGIPFKYVFDTDRRCMSSLTLRGSGI